VVFNEAERPFVSARAMGHMADDVDDEVMDWSSLAVDDAGAVIAGIVWPGVATQDVVASSAASPVLPDQLLPRAAACLPPLPAVSVSSDQVRCSADVNSQDLLPISPLLGPSFPPLEISMPSLDPPLLQADSVDLGLPSPANSLESLLTAANSLSLASQPVASTAERTFTRSRGKVVLPRNHFDAAGRAVPRILQVSSRASRTASNLATSILRSQGVAPERHVPRGAVAVSVAAGQPDIVALQAKIASIPSSAALAGAMRLNGEVVVPLVDTALLAQKLGISQRLEGASTTARLSQDTLVRIEERIAILALAATASVYTAEPQGYRKAVTDVNASA
jgi:hypothetical protein